MTKAATKKTATKKRAAPKAPAPPPLAVASRACRDRHGRPFTITVRVAGVNVNGHEIAGEVAAQAVAQSLLESFQRWKPA